MHKRAVCFIFFFALSAAAAGVGDLKCCIAQLLACSLQRLQGTIKCRASIQQIYYKC